MVRIGLISGAALVREGLRTLLAREHETELVAELPDGAEVAARMAASKPKLVVVDFGAPNAAPTTAALVAAGVNVLALIPDVFERTITAALSSGALAIVPDDSLEDEVMAAVRDGVQGRRHLSPALLRPRHDGAPKFALLSKREREVFMLIAKGLNNRQIAQLLFISPKTVETHRGKIYEKFGAHCIADIVHAAYRDGIISA